MWLVDLAWKNLWRNKSRTIITMAAVFFAVVLSVLTGSLTKGVFDHLIKNVVGFYTGYIQVHKQGYWDEQILDNSFANDAQLAAVSLGHPNVSSIAPRLESFALASSEQVTKGCMVVGIDPQMENTVTGLQEKVSAGRYLNAHDRAVLLGSGLADRLQLTIGDTVVMIGQGYHGAMAAGKYEVAGLLKFGAPNLNDGALFMPLALAQELYGAEAMITSWVLSLHDPKETDRTAAGVQKLLGNGHEVMTWEQMLPEIRQHIES
ncbi:MAG TPA: ABC transporter permease, partial [Phnomibacter sp.]|nr:ABC transporter permease [Phnomibacter sp.]